MERNELLKELQELSKEKDLDDEDSSDEREMGRDLKDSLISSTAKFMMRERKLSTGVGASTTCFKNI
jgi:hypothetical protein